MKWPVSIPIKQAALILISGVLVLVSLIGGFALHEMRNVSRNLMQSNQTAARTEMVAAVERLSNQIKNQAGTLAHWDETRQQLVEPEYYTYWRDQRVYEGGMLSRFARVALYDQTGTMLAPAQQKMVCRPNCPPMCPPISPPAGSARRRASSSCITASRFIAMSDGWRCLATV